VADLLVLFNSPGSPAFARIRTGTALGIALPNAIFFLWIASLAFKAQRQAPQTGGEAMMGKSGLVRSKISPRGMVLVNGELWQARAEETLESGTDVIVEGRDGFTLQVRRKTPSEPDAT
jgi:membrane-bound serine protease (ClpP class)